MQGETEPSMKVYAVSNDCGDDASRSVHQHHHCGGRNFLDRTTKQCHKYQNAQKKPFWFRNRQSKIKLPTRFLLGGTINDPLNLEGLEKEHTRQSEVHTCKRNRQMTTLNPSHRIDFPKISDISDPLNLKNVSIDEPESLSNDCVATPQKWNEGNSHCQETLETEQLLHVMPGDENEQIVKHDSPSMDTSASVTERWWTCNNSFTLDVRNQHRLSVPECATNHCETSIPVEASGERASDIPVSNECSVSIFNDDRFVTCTDSNVITSREKIVSPAVSQYSHHRARKRKQSASLCKETFLSAGSPHKSYCKKRKEKFPRGNYVAYYGYRNVNKMEDPRLPLLSNELFESKDVLDIGCNVGVVTIAVASTYLPRQILGIDVDQRLVNLAKRNVRQYLDERSYPSCLKSTFGPIAASLLPSAECSSFPHNVLFQVGDYVPSSDADLARQYPEYDVILALSVTKWIHLTHGDAGLKRAFVRMFLQLRAGGKLVLEAQPWASYKRKKKLTEKIFEVYQSIRFKPEHFNDYLMSAEVGFSSCILLGTPVHKSKGFQRSIYLFTKPHAATVTCST